jgi:hypothetical protein
MQIRRSRAEKLSMVYSAVRQLEPEAYGYAICSYLERNKGCISYGLVYVLLDELVQSGYLTSWVEKPTGYRAARRHNKPTKYFKATGKVFSIPTTATDQILITKPAFAFTPTPPTPRTPRTRA